ncbi:MAG: hydantoinase/oxoprolinase family protein [Beijerinckiaceae bacterium]
MGRYRIGVDVGGTHTDVALTDSEGRAYRIEKVPSTPHNPAIAVLAGIDRLIASGVAPHEIAFFSHGTTATTNALLEMKGARTALLINAGLSAILEVQTQGRDGWSPFDHFFQRPEKLVRPRFVREIAGRLDYRGREIEPLDENAVREAARSLRAQGVQSVGVCFLFSFMNAAHERRAADIVREEAPGVFVSLSSAVLPRLREWPRFSTTMLNAWLAPVLARYCAEIAQGLDERGVHTRQRFLMQSNGGVMPLNADAEVHAVRTLLSGPAAGVRGASYLLGAIQGWRNLVTMDIGGTSCDIAFIESGEPLEQAESVIDGRVVGVPALDVTTVAAGGGSIARVDAAGMPQVGPRSAGASPGPACYGRGGEEPTTTDANLVCGALNPDYFLGGEMKLDLDAARRAIETRLAKPMGVSVTEAAAGVLRIVNANMSDAIRIEAAKKGLDLAGHTLVPFGGAGPVHAALVAEDLGVARVLVPRNPGAFSALGLLCSDVRHDYLRSEMASLADLDAAHAESCFAGLEDRARAEIAQEGLDAANAVFHRELDLRYAGQGYELRVALEGIVVPMDAGALSAIAERFHKQHAAVHGHCAEDSDVEIVSYRLRAIVRMPKYAPELLSREMAAAPPSHGARRVTLGPSRSFDALIFRRDDIAAGWRAPGPLIVEQKDSTTLVPDGWSVRCDEWSNLILERTSA